MISESDDLPSSETDAHDGDLNAIEGTAIWDHDGTHFLYPDHGTMCSMDKDGAIHYGSASELDDLRFSLGAANGDTTWVADDGKLHRGVIGGSGPDMGLGGLV